MIRHLSIAFGLSHRAALFATLAMASVPVVTLAASAGSPPAAPSHVCLEQLADCGVVPPSPKGAKKWHPGHYMQTLQNVTQSMRFSYYDAISDNPHITGVVVGLMWSELEGPQGDYSKGIALITATLNKLKTLTVPKRLFIRMHPMCYGTCGADDDTKYYPAYIVKMGGAGRIRSGSMVAFWNPAVTDRYIALMQALAKAFDDDPYFEGIAPIRETAAGPVNGNFTWDSLDTQLRRLALASSRAFVKSNVVFFVNGMGGAQTRVDSFIAYLHSIQAGVGAPDTASIADYTYAPHLRTLMGISGGVDYRGKMPVIWSVEATELGLNAGRKGLDYTAQQVFDINNSEYHSSHLFWTRQMFTGTSAQKWDPGMLAVINANPMTHTDCPKDYVQGCVTK